VEFVEDMPLLDLASVAFDDLVPDEVEQLDKTDRLSQKAESVSGLSVLLPLANVGGLLPFVCLTS
jgi:hypothetical protein